MSIDGEAIVQEYPGGPVRAQSVPNMQPAGTFETQQSMERTHSPAGVRGPPPFPKLSEKARSTWRENQDKYKDYNRGHGDGILQRRAYQDSIAGLRTSPKYSVGLPNQVGGIYRISDAPSPATYSLPSFGEQGRGNSWGCTNRFKYGEPPWRKKPGPGDHDPKPVDKPQARRCGFGGSSRGGHGIAADGPGPGAYELKPFGTDGIKYSAQGLPPQAYTGPESSPSPCTYDPEVAASTKFKQNRKVGFGTSTRGRMLMGEPNPSPGPGMYELQKYHNVGANAKKFSIISRRRDYSFEDHAMPGPGNYNTDYTSFVGRHVQSF